MQTLNPTWCGVLPLLIYTIATSTESTAGETATAELRRAAEALDAWNERAPLLRSLLLEIRECLHDEEYAIARAGVLRAIELLDGES